MGDELQMALQVAVALALGGLAGLEREIHHKSAGLRTHMLVAGGSALLMSVGIYLINHLSTLVPLDAVRADPTRVIQAIIVGISVIGAGTIIHFQQEERVKNLTTAATILFTSAIGISAGLGLFRLALAATVLLVLVNGVIGEIERIWKKKTNPETNK